MIFKNMLGRVLKGLSNFSPVKNLIKYILDRSLNELLSDQVALEDFKNGELLLTNIGLNLEKINRDYLLSSPYILHQGRIRSLKVTLPGWSELSTRSIEVAAEGLQLDLKPNKSFADNFKEAMREQSAEILQQEEPGELNETNPMDFFRQLVKQIILNMKIRIENAVVRLFINEPAAEPTAKPQFYLMTRLPLLTIGKGEDAPVREEGTEEIKFDLVVPQLSVHLLREGADCPEYANEKVGKEEFPFLYPPVFHPSTVLLVGQAGLVGERATKLTITLTTHFKKQRKVVGIEGRVASFELTLDPIQMRILSRFVAQLRQFQRILRSVMAELGLAQQPLGLSRRDSKGKSANHDFFSSIMMMSISEPRQPPSAEIGLLNSMMQAPEMLQAAAEFNQNAVAQLRSSGSLEEGEEWKDINFKQEMRVSFVLDHLQANFPKYVTAAAFERRWAAEGEGERLNESLGCSHFRVSVRGVSYSFSSGSNLHEVRLRVARLQDVRLKNQQSFHFSVSEEFYELDSATYYHTSANQDYFTRQPDLLAFRRGNDQHYCLEELFRLSEGQEPLVQAEGVRSYAFMPKGAQVGEGAGLLVSFNGDSKALRVEIREVAVMVNLEIWKDVLNIVYPVFLYRRLHERINLQAPQLDNDPRPSDRPLDLFESQYRFSGMLLEEAEAKEQRLELRVRVGLVYCFYREAQGLKSKQNLMEEVEKKILDSDNFSKHCFCGLTERGLYAEIHDSEWQQVGKQFNLAVGEVKAGLLGVVDSRVQEDVKPILVLDRLRLEQTRNDHRREGRPDTLLRTRVYLPRARFSVELPALISFVEMAKRLVGVVDSLQSFKRSLSAKLLLIEQELGSRSRTGKEKAGRERVVEVFAGEVELRMLLLSVYLRAVYFQKRGGEQQLKVDALALGLVKPLDLRLAQFRNQLLTQQYPLTEKYPGIRDTHLILEAGRDTRARLYSSPPSDPKGKRRLQRKLQFFSEVEKEALSVWCVMGEKVESGGRESRAFRFDKARKNSVIEEEKRIKTVTLLPLTLHLHAANLAFLLHHKQEIQGIIAQVTQVLEEIREESKELIDHRKDSIESEGETTTELLLSLKDLQLNVDVRPDFQYNAETGVRVLSNSRMWVAVRMPKLQAIINPDSQQASLELALGLSAHFLHYADKDVELNPLLLSEPQLEGLGFRRVLEVCEVIGKASVNGKTGVVEAEGDVEAVRVELCLTSIPLLQLFLDHFLRHSLAGDFGFTEEENFVVLEGEQEDEPEDLTQKLEEYEQLLQEKRRAFNEYSMREFGVREGEGRVRLRALRVGAVKVRLFGGHEFRFLEVNSLYESKATQRARSEDPDLLNYLALTLENLRVRSEVGERTQALVELERMGLLLSYKRREGLLWGAEKDYSAHLLKINSPLKLLLDLAPDYLKLKLSTLELTASLTDEVFGLAEQFAKAAKAASGSSWKRQYGSKDGRGQGAGEGRCAMVLVMVPEGRITASAELKRTKLLSERVLRLQELVIHEEQGNQLRIGQICHEWAMRVFTSNLGTLVSGALFEVLSACVVLFIGGLRQLLALFLPWARE